MGHGTPDWWGAAPKETTYALVDMAELAARLGSVVNYDRTGGVLAIDEFTEGLTTISDVGAPTQGSVYPSIAGTKGKGIALCMHALAGAQYSAAFGKYLPFYVLGGLGIEMSFAFDTNLGYFEYWAYVCDGTNQGISGVRYNHPTGQILVRDSSGNFQVIGTPGQVYYDPKAFHTLKLVVNTLTGKYVRVRFNGYTYDASAYTPQVSGWPFEKYIQVIAKIGQTGSSAMIAYVKNMIVTQNELL
jgi:hypothetical protein